MNIKFLCPDYNFLISSFWIFYFAIYVVTVLRNPQKSPTQNTSTRLIKKKSSSLVVECNQCKTPTLLLFMMGVLLLKPPLSRLYVIIVCEQSLDRHNWDYFYCRYTFSVSKWWILFFIIFFIFYIKHVFFFLEQKNIYSVCRKIMFIRKLMWTD